MRELDIHTGIGIFTGVADLVEFDGEFRYTVRFLGIPFAKPPVGEQRFSRPEPYGNFTSPYNATYHRPHCIQTQETYAYLKDYKQSEDCLYLNVYIPGNTINDENNYPVMIYIHGGSFVDGGADVYDGEKLTAFHEVIVVTINYRLNIFGFLSDGSRLNGNYGLWDMKLAIQWVHDNVKTFGGDPNRVTLFGNSAGGAAVLYQALNPTNRGLFQRIIAQSGSCFAFWAAQNNPTHNFNWYTSSVGCDSEEYCDIMKCLKERPIDSLKLWETKYTTQFVPSVDGDFLPEDPMSLSKRKTRAGKDAMDFFSELDFLNGVSSNDGAFALAYWSAEMAHEDIAADIATGVPQHFFTDKYIPEILTSMFGNIPQVLVESVKHQYTDWSNQSDPVGVRGKLLDFECDVTFFVAASYASMMHQPSTGYKSSKNNYFYVFNHKPDFAPEPKWLTGATHVMELPYVFGFPKSLETKLVLDYDAVDPLQVSQEDLIFSKQMMTYWTSFAKTG